MLSICYINNVKFTYFSSVLYPPPWYFLKTGPNNFWPSKKSPLSLLFVRLPKLQVRGKNLTLGKAHKVKNLLSKGNLYLTLLFHLPTNFFPFLPLISITNTYKTIKYFLDQEKVKKIIKIKWINDILIDF